MYKTKLFDTPAFSTLAPEDRLFLYSVRHWARRIHESRTPRVHSRMLPLRKQGSGPVEAHIDAFLRCFVEALPEAFVVKAPHCRCALQFHEATLMDLFKSVKAADTKTAVRTVSDCMSLQTIERLLDLLCPVVSEIELAVQDLR